VDGGDAGALVSAAPNCKDPELRIRIERIVAHKGGGQIYCVLSASDGATSEVAITAKTKSLVDEQTHYFDPAGATFWGQKVLHPTTNNLTVSYNCFRVKGDSWSKVLGAMGDSAAKQAGSDAAGQYGWAFGAGSVAADAAAAAVQAGVGDELTFNAQQVIDKTGLMDLTNGRYWTIRKSQKGGVFGGGWDWEIFLQAWGCADAVGASR
jgi:hypothetical protein